MLQPKMVAPWTDISNIGDCNWTRNQNHLVRKRTLNHSAIWPNWYTLNLTDKMLEKLAMICYPFVLNNSETVSIFTSS